MDYSFWSLLRKPTVEEQKSASSIKRIKTVYPSLRVVGRGTVVVDPKEIKASDNFQRDLVRAKDLVIR